MKDIAGSFRIEGFHQEYAMISFIIDKVALKVYSSASFFRRVDMPEIERRVIEVIQEHCSPADVPGMRSVHPTDLLRSEEHTSELQSQSNLVCRLLLLKKAIGLIGTTFNPCSNVLVIITMAIG